MGRVVSRWLGKLIRNSTQTMLTRHVAEGAQRADGPVLDHPMVEAARPPRDERTVGACHARLSSTS